MYNFDYFNDQMQKHNSGDFYITLTEWSQKLFNVFNVMILKVDSVGILECNGGLCLRNIVNVSLYMRAIVMEKMLSCLISAA